MIDEINFDAYMPTASEVREILLKIGNLFVEKFIRNVYEQKNWNGQRLQENSIKWFVYKKYTNAPTNSLMYKDLSFVDKSKWEVTVNGQTLYIKMMDILKIKFNALKELDISYNRKYTYIMPDIDIKKEKEWFQDTFFELMCEMITKKESKFDGMIRTKMR